MDAYVGGVSIEQIERPNKVSAPQPVLVEEGVGASDLGVINECEVEVATSGCINSTDFISAEPQNTSGSFIPLLHLKSSR
ncbi:hypothetical protein ACLOJK_030056 [Asimina triloba]